MVLGFSSLFLFLLVERTSCNENGMRGTMSENGGDLSSFKWGQEKDAGEWKRLLKLFGCIKFKCITSLLALTPLLSRMD